VTAIKHTSDNRNPWAIFGDEAGSITARREYKNSTRVLLGRRSNGGDGHSLCSLCGAGLEISEFVVKGRMADSMLSKKTCFGHHENCTKNLINREAILLRGDETDLIGWVGAFAVSPIA